MASLVWGCCRLIGAMPHWLRYYVLQDTIYFIVYKCLRYRVGVVTENLRNSFPDRPMAEIKRIRRSFYHNLSEIFISTVSQAAMSDDDCRRRVRVKNLDEVLSDLRGRDALLSTAHFGCWEYDSFLALYTGEHYLAAVYHPLENKVIDAVYMRLRRRRNIRLIPMKEIIRYYIDHRLPAGAPGQRIGIGLIADQNPPLRPNSHWFRFLNQDTVFFRRHREDGAQISHAGLFLPPAPAAPRVLRVGVPAPLRRRGAGRAQRGDGALCAAARKRHRRRSGDVALVASPLETPSSAMSVVKIVILNWNGAAHLRRFLPSVVRTAPPGVEIVVADNGSTDGSAALVEREFPSVTLLRLPENYGFAGGYNRALERLEGDYWVLLNSDVEPAEGVVGAADRGARRAARRGCRGAETALLRRARPVRVCGCCGRIHRLVRFPVLSGTYPADVGEGSGGSTTTPAMSFG